MRILPSTMLLLMFLVSLLSLVGGEVIEEIPPSPKPYSFSYSAGRAPGHTDRVHAEVSDGTGVIRGMFSYVDPRHKVQTVEYIADQQGFHPLYVSNTQTDTKAVKQEKAKHAALFQKIALEQQRLAEERGQFELDDGSYKPQPGENIQPIIEPVNLPRDTVSVNLAKQKHLVLYEKIAQDHARIAAEREINSPETNIHY